MSMQPISTADVLDEIERLEQSITRTLQEIDQSFSDCQSIVSSKILPQIDRYSESSLEVWNHARLWLNFFEAALTPPSATTAADGGGKRSQAARIASIRSKQELQQLQEQREQDEREDQQQHELLQGNNGFNPTASQSRAAQSPHRQQQQHHRMSYTSVDDLSEDNSTNRQRIDSINLESPRFSTTFLGSSPLASLPGTPLANRGRIFPTSINSPAHATTTRQDSLSTPQRPRYDYMVNSPLNGRGSTTPKITLKDRPMAFSTYTRTNSALTSNADAGQSTLSVSTPKKTLTSTSAHTEHSHSPMRGTRDGGFLELDLNEDHQDVITPPSTLQFSVPESRIPGTPRSVLAKSLVDKIRIKDGLVVPQPIFVNDDEDDDVVEDETAAGFRQTDQAAIGGSKKRSRDGDLLEDHYDEDREGMVEEEYGTGRPLRSSINPTRWSSLTKEQRNKERLLKSPRKMASVQDFFAPQSSSTSEQEAESQRRSPSPSRQLMSQILSQSAEESAATEDEDPLLAQLRTPPEFRAIRERYSVTSTSHLPSHPVTAPSRTIPTISETSKATPTLPVVPAPTATTAPSRSGSGSSTSMVPPLAPTARPVNSTPIVTPIPLSATPGNGAGSATSIGSIFRDSFSSGLAASSANRRQTMAGSGAHRGGSIVLGTGTSSSNHRNSIGPGYKPPQLHGSTSAPLLGNLRPATLSASGSGSAAASVDAAGLTRTYSNTSITTPANSRLSLVGNNTSGNSRLSIVGSSNYSSSRLSLLGNNNAGNSRLSLVGNNSTAALRKPLYPTAVSLDNRVSASAGVALASTTTTTAPNSGTNTVTGLTSKSDTRPNGSNLVPAITTADPTRSRQSIPASSKTSTTPVTGAAASVVKSTLNSATGMRRSLGSGVTPTSESRSDAAFSPARGGFTTPTFSDRNPPPAPRLGYHSDTLMTQSSLGLNHDGLYGSQTSGSHDDRTRTTLHSASPGRRMSSVQTNSSEGGSSPFTTSTTTTTATAKATVVEATRRTTYPKTAGLGSTAWTTGRSFLDRVKASETERSDRDPFTDTGDIDDEYDDDEDVTENMMRSPCPPGKTLPFMGSKTDLKSVAAATAAASGSGSIGGGSLGSLFSRRTSTAAKPSGSSTTGNINASLRRSLSGSGPGSGSGNGKA
ncbi:DASH complex subunit ask1 [Gryganskiella cystojenkinii]|nr:DASH complex subunit ask1 [Gryganskiella cystojenkinii]